MKREEKFYYLIITTSHSFFKKTNIFFNSFPLKFTCVRVYVCAENGKIIFLSKKKKPQICVLTSSTVTMKQK